MTQPAPQVPPLDTGNQLLTETPAIQMTALIGTPAGQRLACTIRTPSTTLTVLLTQADAKTWAANLKLTAESMSGAGLIVAGPGTTPNGLTLKGQG